MVWSSVVKSVCSSGAVRVALLDDHLVVNWENGTDVMKVWWMAFRSAVMSDARLVYKMAVKKASVRE